MSTENAILGLLTETSLHAGSGQNLGVIDLPIQREAHTNWPFVYASSVKGSMRSMAGEKWNDKNKELVKEIFGPEMSHGISSAYAGALVVGDARLLLLPVRSLTSHFKWVTCPALLRRFQADCRRLGLAEIFQIPENTEKALVFIGENLDSGLFLEEFRFEVEHNKLLGEIIAAIAPFLDRDDAEVALEKQLVVVNDDVFSHISSYATPVNAHIKIEDNLSKRVQKGALWYEETLPSDTLLYVPLVANAVRKEGSEKKADYVLGKIKDLFGDSHPYLQLGGNETVGMGWCKVKVKGG